MPPADAIPASRISTKLIHPAQSPEVCQGCTGAATRPAILLVERLTERTTSLITALRKTIGWQVIHTQSDSEALVLIRTLRAELKVTLITIGRKHDRALSLIRRLNENASILHIPQPYVVVLSLVPEMPNLAVGFEKVGAHYLLRAYPEQIVEVVRKLQWQSRTDKALLTILLRRRAGHITTVLIRQSTVEVPVILGPRLRKTIEYFVLHPKTEHTTGMVADALGVCRQSVKEYLLRLRRALDRACVNGSLAWQGKDILWTRRIEGGFIHGIRANVEISDAPDLNYSDIVDDPMRIERDREVSDVPNPH
jgi:hypothetical protein